MELNEMHHFIYADNINILVGNINTVKKHEVHNIG
jgi:hypothetical protein